MGRTDTYGYDEERVQWFERFTVTPVDPAPTTVIHRSEDKTLETLDIPAHLDRQLVVEADPGTALYRLVQLFGTPNVPGFEAGGISRERSVTTWQYLFDVTYEPPGKTETVSLLLSVYDYKTDVSTGLSAWTDDDNGNENENGNVTVLDPVECLDECSSLASISDDEFLEGVVQLVLNMTEEPVRAAHKQLWV